MPLSWGFLCFRRSAPPGHDQVRGALTWGNLHFCRSEACAPCRPVMIILKFSQVGGGILGCRPSRSSAGVDDLAFWVFLQVRGLEMTFA